MYIYTYLYTCIYIYNICIHVHIHMHMYTYMYDSHDEDLWTCIHVNTLAHQKYPKRSLSPISYSFVYLGHPTTTEINTQLRTRYTCTDTSCVAPSRAHTNALFALFCCPKSWIVL